MKAEDNREETSKTEGWEDFKQQLNKQEELFNNYRKYIINQKRRSQNSPASIYEESSTKIIGVMSTKGGCGKSSFGIGLSAFLAKLHARVHFVDLDYSTRGATIFFSQSSADEFEEGGGLNLDENNYYSNDEIIEDILQGKFDKDKLTNKKKPFAYRFGKKKSWPQGDFHFEKFYTTLFRKSVREVEGIEMGDMIYYFSLCTPAIIENNILTHKPDFLVLDLGAGQATYQLLGLITHPIFMAEADNPSMQRIEELGEAWKNARRTKLNDLHMEQNLSLHEETTAAPEEKQDPITPYLLINRVRRENLITPLPTILKEHPHFFILPPVLESSCLKTLNVGNFIFKCISDSVPYCIQLLRVIKLLFPGDEELFDEEFFDTVFADTHTKLRSQPEIINVRDDFMLHHDIGQIYTNALEENCSQMTLGHYSQGEVLRRALQLEEAKPPTKSPGKPSRQKNPNTLKGKGIRKAN